jgi:hypothetical protein
MKKAPLRGDDVKAHYDFSGGVRGKYAERYSQGTNVVVLDPDVAAVFRDRESVNETLRAVARIIDLQSRTGRTIGRAKRNDQRSKPARKRAR